MYSPALCPIELFFIKECLVLTVIADLIFKCGKNIICFMIEILIVFILSFNSMETVHLYIIPINHLLCFQLTLIILFIFLNFSYSLQCVLPINNFVEKIYIFLWFWFVILCALTIMNTLQWTINTMLPVRRVYYIKQYLKALRLISSTEERDCTRFVNQNLGADGIFILHIVSKIASDLIALDVTATLWKNYRQAKITGTEEDVNRLLETVNRGSSAV